MRIHCAHATEPVERIHRVKTSIEVRMRLEEGFDSVVIQCMSNDGCECS